MNVARHTVVPPARLRMILEDLVRLVTLDAMLRPRGDFSFLARFAFPSVALDAWELVHWY